MPDCSTRTDYLREAKKDGHLGNCVSAHAQKLSKLPIEKYAELQATRYEAYKKAKVAVAEAVAILVNDEEPKMINGALDERWFKRRCDLRFKASRALEHFGDIASDLELGIVKKERY